MRNKNTHTQVEILKETRQRLILFKVSNELRSYDLAVSNLLDLYDLVKKESLESRNYIGIGGLWKTMKKNTK